MKKLIFLLLLLNSTYGINAQKNDLSKYKTSTIGKIDPIFLNDTLTGYCIQSYLDQTSETEKTYNFTFYDLDLKETNTMEFVINKYGSVLDYKFNGKVLVIYYKLSRFQSITGKNVSGVKDEDLGLYCRFINIDKSKEIINLKIADENNKIRAINQIIPVKYKGFIFSYRIQSSYFYSNIEAYDNDGKLLWIKKNHSFCKDFNDKILLAKNLDTTQIYAHSDLILVDFLKDDSPIVLNSFKYDDSVYSYPLDLLKYENHYYCLTYQTNWTKVKKKWKPYPDFNKNAKQYILSKYDNNGKLIFEKSINGDFNEEFSDETVYYAPYNYTKERLQIDKMVIEGNQYLFFCKKYNKNSTLDFMVFRLDSNLKILAKKNYTSDYKNVDLQLSLMINAMEFNTLRNLQPLSYYKYSSTIPSDYVFFHRQNLNPIYFIPNGKEKQTSTGAYQYNSFALEFIGLNDESEIFNSKLQFDLQYDYYQILPAKPGYVCIFEYFEKEKKIDFRLEKFDF